ncbi:MAG TPA: nuclear transport factor 2 family protein [Chitinophagaceae bacterium]|nr:nuclear transport factor 2 family protein [Chitinophagaceae bacterium]
MEVLVHNDLKVKNIYEAFSNGDIEAIISELHPQVNWSVMGKPDIPYAGNFKGKNEVRKFFNEMNKSIEVLEMKPEHYFEETQNGKDLVVVTGYYKAKILKTGKKTESIWCMIWEFNDDGQVISFKDIYDTHDEYKAWN